MIPLWEVFPEYAVLHYDTSHTKRVLKYLYEIGRFVRLGIS